jgi:hypothetical protein
MAYSSVSQLMERVQLAEHATKQSHMASKTGTTINI